MAQGSMITASCTVTIALLISYGYLYLSEKKTYILTWILSLFLLLGAYLSRMIMVETGSEYAVFLIINYTCTLAGYGLIFMGIHLFFAKKVSILWEVSAAVLILIYAVQVFFAWPARGILLASVAYTVALLLKSGWICLRASKPKSLVRAALGYSFFVWAALSLVYPLSHIFEVIPASVGYLLIGVIGLIVFITIQAVYFLSMREEIEQKEANIRNLVAYDKLTGAYSRAYFEQTLADFLNALALPAVLIMADFNGLKLINDTFGHEKGDELLINGVKAVQAGIAEDGVIVRWGGDEFIILMPHKTVDEAEKLIEKIKAQLNLFRPEAVPLNISFGTAAIEDKNRELGELIKLAEDKMYSNKLSESRETRKAIIKFLEKLLWDKDYQTEEHVMRLKSLAVLIGGEIGLSSREMVDLAQVALLHDIGKIGIPTEILNKSGALTEDEWRLLKKHSEIGYRITQASRELAHISEAILAHHEWWDGSGYPQGLKGEEIPLYARIVSIVDSYDVMTNERPYKQKVRACDAIAEINKWSGIQFDPQLVAVFNKMMNMNTAAAGAMGDD